MSKVRFVVYQGLRKGQVVCSCVDNHRWIIGFANTQLPYYHRGARYGVTDYNLQEWKQRAKRMHGAAYFRKVIVERNEG